jgi:hypothetical protein
MLHSTLEQGIIEPVICLEHEKQTCYNHVQSPRRTCLEKLRLGLAQKVLNDFDGSFGPIRINQMLGTEIQQFVH